MSYPDYDLRHHHHHHHPHHSLPSPPLQRPTNSGPPRRSFEYGSGPINTLPRPWQSSRNASGASYHLSPQFYAHQPLPSPTSQNGHAHAHFEPYSQLPPPLSSSPQAHYQLRQSPHLQHQSLHPPSAAVTPMSLPPPHSALGQRSRSSSQASGMERHSGESRRSRGSSRSRSRRHSYDRPHHHHRHSHHSEDSIDALERDLKNVEHRPTLGDSIFAAFSGMRRLVSARRD